MPAPVSTPILRLIHIENLESCLQHRSLYSPNHAPKDGKPWKSIHNKDIQLERQIREIPCGPKGVIHDYVPFYFGQRSPMLLQLHSGRVEGYNEGQEPLIYLVSNAQLISENKCGFVFSDGHGIAAFTTWFDDLRNLNAVDWEIVVAIWWNDTLEDGDRQRRKQAEFLVHKTCDWAYIKEIVVLNDYVKSSVDAIMAKFHPRLHKPVSIQPTWYY